MSRAIELNSNDDLALAHRGETYRAMGRNEEALADFTRAFELDQGLNEELGTGTHWAVEPLADSTFGLRCLGSIDGPRMLDERTSEPPLARTQTSA